MSAANLTILNRGLSDGDLRQRFAEPARTQITDINLANNALTSEAVAIIVDSPKTEGITWLNLSRNGIGDEGLGLLARSTRLTTIKRLLLAQVGATGDGVRVLAASPHFGTLQTLSLAYQAVGDVGAEALAAMGGVEQVNLTQAAITGAGAQALVARGHFASLDLSDNPLGQGALVGLTELSPHLRTLSLSQTGIGAKDFAALAAATAPALLSLDVNNNKIDDAGVLALASATWLGQLETLVVSGYFASTSARRELIAAWGERPGLTVERRDLD